MITKQKIKKETKEALSKFCDKEEELIDTMPEGFMVHTNKQTGEKYINFDHYDLMRKINNNRFNAHKELINSLLNILKRIVGK